MSMAIGSFNVLISSGCGQLPGHSVLVTIVAPFFKLPIHSYTLQFHKEPYPYCAEKSSMDFCPWHIFCPQKKDYYMLLFFGVCSVLTLLQ
jgi:hypothetical protein